MKRDLTEDELAAIDYLSFAIVVAIKCFLLWLGIVWDVLLAMLPGIIIAATPLLIRHKLAGLILCLTLLIPYGCLIAAIVQRGNGDILNIYRHTYGSGLVALGYFCCLFAGKRDNAWHLILYFLGGSSIILFGLYYLFPLYHDGIHGSRSLSTADYVAQFADHKEDAAQLVLPADRLVLRLNYEQYKNLPAGQTIRVEYWPQSRIVRQIDTLANPTGEPR